MMENILPVWITSTASVIGVIYAIVRNGSRQKKQDEKLKTELKLELDHIKQKLDDPENGLSSIKKCVDSQKLHCVEVSTRIEGKCDTNAREIDTLRKKR